MSLQTGLFLRQYGTLSALDAMASPETKTNYVTAAQLSQLEALNIHAGAGNAIAGQSLQVLSQIQAELANGFAGLKEAFSWGIAKLCWEAEQTRDEYRKTLDVLRHPLATQGLELRDRAEKAIQNKWWDNAITDLMAALENNRYDFLAHLQLAQVLFFELDRPSEALEHFDMAAKYADAADASEQEKHYAAVAYAHLAMLRRLSYQSGADQAEGVLSGALSAAERAVSLEPALLAARQELTLLLCICGREEEALSQVADAIKLDERLAHGIAWEQQLEQYPRIASFLRIWGALAADATVAVHSVAQEFETLRAQFPEILQVNDDQIPPQRSMKEGIVLCQWVKERLGQAKQNLDQRLQELLDRQGVIAGLLEERQRFFIRAQLQAVGLGLLVPLFILFVCLSTDEPFSPIMVLLCAGGGTVIGWLVYLLVVTDPKGRYLKRPESATRDGFAAIQDDKGRLPSSIARAREQMALFQGNSKLLSTKADRYIKGAAEVLRDPIRAVSAKAAIR